MQRMAQARSAELSAAAQVRCKGCGRMNDVSLVPPPPSPPRPTGKAAAAAAAAAAGVGEAGAYVEDGGEWQRVATFECRGVEPVQQRPLLLLCLLSLSLSSYYPSRSPSPYPSTSPCLPPLFMSLPPPPISPLLRILVGALIYHEVNLCSEMNNEQN